MYFSPPEICVDTKCYCVMLWILKILGLPLFEPIVQQIQLTLAVLLYLAGGKKNACSALVNGLFATTLDDFYACEGYGFTTWWYL